MNNIASGFHRKYWILNGVNFIRPFLTLCFNHSAKTNKLHLPGNLQTTLNSWLAALLNTEKLLLSHHCIPMNCALFFL